jgi:hypothetical protein
MLFKVVVKTRSGMVVGESIFINKEDAEAFRNQQENKGYASTIHICLQHEKIDKI